MAQVTLLKRGATVDGGVAARRPVGHSSLPDCVRRHPASLVALATRAPPAEVERQRPEYVAIGPEYVTIGMVLLSAAAVFEGYRWLNVIPGSRTGLTTPAFALLALPTASSSPGHTAERDTDGGPG